MYGGTNNLVWSTACGAQMYPGSSADYGAPRCARWGLVLGSRAACLLGWAVKLGRAEPSCRRFGGRAGCQAPHQRTLPAVAFRLTPRTPLLPPICSLVRLHRREQVQLERRADLQPRGRQLGPHVHPARAGVSWAGWDLQSWGVGQGQRQQGRYVQQLSAGLLQRGPNA